MRKIKKVSSRVVSDVLAGFVQRLIERNGTDVRLMGRPIRPDIDTMLGGFLQIEEYSTAEDAEERGTT